MCAASNYFDFNRWFSFILFHPPHTLRCYCSTFVRLWGNFPYEIGFKTAVFMLNLQEKLKFANDSKKIKTNIRTAHILHTVCTGIVSCKNWNKTRRQRERRKYKNWRNTMEKEMRRAHLKSQTLKSFSLRNLRELSFCYTINTKRAYGRSEGSADSWAWPLLPLLPKWSGINQKTVWRFRLHHLFKCIKLHRVGVGKSTMYRHV